MTSLHHGDRTTGPVPNQMLSAMIDTMTATKMTTARAIFLADVGMCALRAILTHSSNVD